jgi:hypothetical protein
MTGHLRGFSLTGEFHYIKRELGHFFSTNADELPSERHTVFTRNAVVFRQYRDRQDTAPLDILTVDRGGEAASADERQQGRMR